MGEKGWGGSLNALSSECTDTSDARRKGEWVGEIRCALVASDALGADKEL